MDSVARRQIAAAAAAGEGSARIEQAPQGGLVQFRTRALENDGLVRFQAEGLQCLDLLPGGARNFPRRVDVFDANQPVSAGVPGEQPTAQGGGQRAEVQGAGRRGGEAPAIAAAGLKTR